jgi:hypothetical protein
MSLRILELRARYYVGKLCAFFGFCWRCRCALNFTRHGRGICPDCGSRY